MPSSTARRQLQITIFVALCQFPNMNEVLREIISISLLCYNSTGRGLPEGITSQGILVVTKYKKQTLVMDN